MLEYLEPWTVLGNPVMCLNCRHHKFYHSNDSNSYNRENLVKCSQLRNHDTNETCDCKRFDDNAYGEKISKKLEKTVPACEEKLISIRLCALQLLTKKKYDKMINNIIIAPLTNLIEYSGPQIQAKFELDKEQLFAGDTINEISPSSAHQFVKDLKIYGIREAVRLLHEAEFKNDPEKFIDDAVQLVAEITKDYLENKPKLVESNDGKIRQLMLVLNRYENEVFDPNNLDFKP